MCIRDRSIDDNNSSDGSGKKDVSDKKTPQTVLTQSNANTTCVTCQSHFPSKNKLFDHLKKTGHSIYIPTNVKSNSSSGNVLGQKGKNKKIKK